MMKSNLKKSIMTSFSDVIAITSPKNITKFFYFAPALSKFLATPVQWHKNKCH